MAIACEVRRVLAKDPSRHKINDMRLEFREPEQKTSTNGITKEQIQKMQKSIWVASTGGADAVVHRTRARPLAIGETDNPGDEYGVSSRA